VKLFASERVLDAALDLLDVTVTQGCAPPPGFQRRLRDAVGGRLYSGTSEMMRRIVARDLGL
jgi:hypothetical protein